MAAHAGVGCNYAVSSGNEADLGLLDFLADLIERPEVEVAVAFMESVDDGRRLIAIGERALELGKPILAWKVGNTAVGSRAAISHSARMTTSYALYRAAFRQGGLIEIREADELIDIAKAFMIRKLPAGNRVGILTMSGGAGVLLADRCIEHGLKLPSLSEHTTHKLRKTLASFASTDNPVDATAQGYNDDFASYTEGLRLVLADPDIDQVVARVPRGRGARPWAENLVSMLPSIDKPVLLNWPSAPDDNGDVLAYLESNGVPCILGAGRAARALAALTDFARRRRDRLPHGKQSLARSVARQALELPAGAGTLSEHRSKQLLQRYGVPVVREVRLQPHEIEALDVAPLAFPIAVKIDSPDVPHKTEARAVRLGIQDLPALKQAARDVLGAAKLYRPDARIEGILLQEMAAGVEVIVGAVNDACFGPSVTFGLGGVFAELLGDVTYGFAPFDTQAARDMILQIKGAPLLDGYRGRPGLDVVALADTLVRVSLLIADHAERIAEIELNPVFAREQGVVAADALIVLKA
jgi:acyl-CoA synthetase (NDP forming)